MRSRRAKKKSSCWEEFPQGALSSGVCNAKATKLSFFLSWAANTQLNHLTWGRLFFWLFVCCYKTRKPFLLGWKWNPWEYIHSGCVSLSAVLPKVHHRPEPLYVPTEVNTPQAGSHPWTYSHGWPLRKQRFQPSPTFLIQNTYACIEL